MTDSQEMSAQSIVTLRQQLVQAESRVMQMEEALRVARDHLRRLEAGEK